MAKTSNPNWEISEAWAVGRDKFNWILFRRSGAKWRPESYYPSAEALLHSLHRKLTRTEPAARSIQEHVAHCLDEAQAAADLFKEHVSTLGLPKGVTGAPAANSASDEHFSRDDQEVRHAP